MFAYRTSVQDTTGATTFSIMFGQEATVPIDLILMFPSLTVKSFNHPPTMSKTYNPNWSNPTSQFDSTWVCNNKKEKKYDLKEH